MEEPKNEKDLVKSVEESVRLTELLHIFWQKYEADETVHDKVVEFVGRLRKKYSSQEIRERQLFHVIAHSSIPSHEKSPYFDFEGEDSIEKFIREL